MTSPYDVLGVPRDADEETIRAAFRKAAKACHPDVNDGDEAAARLFKQIAAARDAILKDRGWYADFRRNLRLGRLRLEGHALRECNDYEFEDRQVRGRETITAGVIFVLLVACLISSGVVWLSQREAMTASDGRAVAAIDRPSSNSGPHDAQFDRGRVMAGAVDMENWDVAAREPAVRADFNRVSMGTQRVGTSDPRMKVTTTDPQIETRTSVQTTGRDSQRPSVNIVAAAPSTADDEPKRAPMAAITNEPSPTPERHKGAPANDRADEPQQTDKPTRPAAATGMASRKTNSRTSAGAPPSGRAAAAPPPRLLSRIASILMPRPGRISRPVYAINRCWTEGNGRSSPCGTGGGRWRGQWWGWRSLRSIRYGTYWRDRSASAGGRGRRRAGGESYL